MKFTEFVIRNGRGGIRLSIDQPADLLLIPLDFEHMKVIGKSAFGQLKCRRMQHGVFVIPVCIVNIGFNRAVVF